MESDQICLARCINRNIMECKELAEKNATNAAVKVLIETLWNVKRILPSFSFNPASCINRNIMECKVFSPLFFYFFIMWY